MPRTYQAPAAVDRTVGQVGSEVTAATSDREPPTPGVADRVTTSATNRPGSELSYGSDLDLRAIAPPGVGSERNATCVAFPSGATLADPAVDFHLEAAYDERYEIDEAG